MGAVAGVGALLLKATARAASPAAGKQGAGLPRRAFGRTGVEVPVLALGAAMDLSENQLILAQCLKRGVTYWDTADGYSNGASETGIGKYFGKHSQDRRRVFLVTKAGTDDPAGMDRHLAASLARMKTDFIDLYFFHGVEDIAAVDRPELKAWAERTKKAGRIRFIGLSTHKNMAPVMNGAAKLGWLDGLMTTYNYRVMHDDDMKRAVDACAAAGMGVTAMKAQGGGPINDTKADRELAGHFITRGFTPEQAKVKAVLEDTRIAAVCSYMDSVEILKSNVAAALDRTKLDAADRKALNRHAAATHASVCGACGRCERALDCPVPVSRIMRYLMYARNYGEHAVARDRFRVLGPAVHRRLAATDFGRAERVCPHALPIGRLMREAALELA